MDRSGLVGEDGPTHHGVFDISFMRHIPNIIISSPKDGFELHDLLHTAILTNKTFAIRYGKIETSYNDNYKPKLIDIGSWNIEKNGSKIAILAVASMVEIGLDVFDEILKNFNLEISVINCRFIKPIDEDLLFSICSNHQFLVTIEEGSRIGGFGSSILEFVNENNMNIKVKTLGIPDKFIEHGSRSELLQKLNLTSKGVFDIIKEYLE